MPLRHAPAHSYTKQKITFLSGALIPLGQDLQAAQLPNALGPTSCCSLHMHCLQLLQRKVGGLHLKQDEGKGSSVI